MDTLMKRVELSCTASANLEARSGETVMPDKADMVGVCDQKGHCLPAETCTAARLVRRLLSRYVHPVVATSGGHICPLSGLQGLIISVVNQRDANTVIVQAPFAQLVESQSPSHSEPVSSTNFEAHQCCCHLTDVTPTAQARP